MARNNLSEQKIERIREQVNGHSISKSKGTEI